MNITVFGGSGFIGSNLVAALISDGHEVTVVDIKNCSNSSVRFFDSTDFSAIESKIWDTEVLVDLVYATNPKTSFDNPILDITSNLPGLIERFNLALKLKYLKKYIFISSGGTVYGESNVEANVEGCELNPISPYGITKLASENYGKMYNIVHELPFISVRPSNAYGIGQKTGTGQGFILTAIHSAFQKEEITIFGENGTIRDYIYISDLCDAIIAITQKGQIGEAYNIGSGIGYNNLEVLDVIKENLSHTDVNLRYKILDSRKFDVKRNVLNIEKITNLTDWRVKVNLKEGTNKLINWYMQTYGKN